jgi:hypothetical protein
MRLPVIYKMQMPYLFLSFESVLYVRYRTNLPYRILMQPDFDIRANPPHSHHNTAQQINQYLVPDTRITVSYDNRLKRIRHPVRSAIHKLVIQWIDTLNRANRHSVESEPLAALRGEARVSRVSREVSRVSRVSRVTQCNVFVSVSCQFHVSLALIS